MEPEMESNGPPNASRNEPCRLTLFANVQHISMYALWCLYAIVEALEFLKSRENSSTLAYVILAFASFSEAFLLVHHSGHENEVAQRAHFAFFLSTIGVGLFSIAEVAVRRSPMASAARHYCLLVKGLWLGVIGVVWLRIDHQWPIEWSEGSGENLFWVDWMFALTASMAALAMLGVAVLANFGRRNSENIVMSN